MPISLDVKPLTLAPTLCTPPALETLVTTPAVIMTTLEATKTLAPTDATALTVEGTTPNANPAPYPAHDMGKMPYRDKLLSPRTFFTGQKVLLYKSRLRLFCRKLKPRWTGPYLVKKVYDHGLVAIQNIDTGIISKVQDHRLELFHEGFHPLKADPPD